MVDDVQCGQQRRFHGPLRGLLRLFEIPFRTLKDPGSGRRLERGPFARLQPHPQAGAPFAQDIASAIIPGIIFARHPEAEIRKRHIPQGDRRRGRIGRDGFLTRWLPGVRTEVQRDLLSETHGHLDPIRQQKGRGTWATPTRAMRPTLKPPSRLRQDARQPLGLGLFRRIKKSIRLSWQQPASAHAGGLRIRHLDPEPESALTRPLAHDSEILLRTVVKIHDDRSTRLQIRHRHLRSADDLAEKKLSLRAG